MRLYNPFWGLWLVSFQVIYGRAPGLAASGNLRRPNLKFFNLRAVALSLGPGGMIMRGRGMCCTSHNPHFFSFLMIYSSWGVS